MQMTFLAPVPWEADAFYAQPGMAERGLTLDVWPVGTGPYMMVEFVKDRYHVMKKNPNYRGEPYPWAWPKCDVFGGQRQRAFCARRQPPRRGAGGPARHRAQRAAEL